ncbi:MAG: BNR repeat-containing protein [Sedimentisphaerales bacterium]|nr:BNR repeat-containing protein [Sedimentisphaerales bacterium]
MKRRLCFVIIYLFSLGIQAGFAFPDVTKLSDSVVTPQSLTIGGASFQQDAVITHNGFQYVTYYSSDRYVCLARRELPSGSWETIKFTDYYFSSSDGHNVITIGICPNDGTIHLSFDHHGSTLHYRFSDVGVATDPCSVTWSTSLFSSVQNHLETGKTVTGLTYPAFSKTPDGNMQMFYRVGGSGDGDWVIVDYNGGAHLWSNTRKFISRSGTYTDQTITSTSRCAYPNYYSYAPNGDLQVIWVWREGWDTANHDIMYSYSDDGGYTWYNDKNCLFKVTVAGSALQNILTIKSSASDANVIGEATGNPSTEKLISLNSPGVTVINMNVKYGLINQQSQAVDPQSRPHTVMWHCTDETLAEAEAAGYTNGLWGHETARRYHHYWRDSNGIWHHYEMDWIAGGRPKLAIAPNNGDAFLVYRDLSAKLTIAAATQATGWTDWQIIHTEPDNFGNEMLFDPVRFAEDQILAVFARQSASPYALRIIELQCN